MAESTQPHDLDESDVSLLDALHVSPRASFEQLAEVLGVSAATVSRRWQRLSATGRAWVSSTPGPRLAVSAAVWEAECAPGRAMDVAGVVATLPQVASVYVTAGDADLTAIVLASDMSALSELVVDRLPTIAGLVRARSRIVHSWYSDVRWRLGVISPSQEQSIGAGHPNRSARRTEALDAEDRALYVALQRNGRAHYRDLAQQLGVTEHLVKRRFTSLTRRGLLAFRTDFTRNEGGWPVQLMLWLAVPDDQLAAVGGEIAGWRETRICLAALGAANLFVNAQLHSLADLDQIADRLRGRLPHAVVVERRMVLRAVKSWGRLLDRSGRAVGVVPVDLWPP